MWPSKRSAIAVNPFRFKTIRAVTSLLGQTATLVLLAFWIPVDIGSPPQAPLCFLQQRRLLVGPLRPAIALVSEPDSCREVESRLLKNYALIHSFMRARSRRAPRNVDECVARKAVYNEIRHPAILK